MWKYYQRSLLVCVHACVSERERERVCVCECVCVCVLDIVCDGVAWETMDTRNTCLHQTGSLNLTSRQCGSFDFFFKRASKHLHTLPGLCNNRYTFNTASHVFQNGNSSLGRAINWKVTRNFAGSSPRCGKGFLSQGQLPVRTFLRCPYSPRV